MAMRTRGPKLAATSRDHEEYASATQRARGVRAGVAQQLHDLLIEGDRMGSRGEMAQRIARVVEAERLIAEAQGRQQQAAEHGLPRSAHAEAEREARSALRSALMVLSVAAGAWVAAIDYEAVRRSNNGHAPSSVF